VAEGGVATTNAIFAVTLNRPSQQAVTFEFATATGTAVSGTDFLATTGTVTFLANTTSNHIAVPVIGDCGFEADENFFINLTNAQFAVLATSFVRGTIVNDDPLPVVFVDGFSLLEGDSEPPMQFSAFACPVQVPSRLQSSTPRLTARQPREAIMSPRTGPSASQPARPMPRS